MIDLSKATDAEVAILQFALERFDDTLEEYGYAIEFEKAADSISNSVSAEYVKRKLTWAQFK